MGRPRTFVILFGAAAALAVVRHRRRATGRRVPGGILIGDTVTYDAFSRLLLGPLFRRIAADLAAVAPDGARVLEVGCGPGHLSIQLARGHGLEVTGLDLDPGPAWPRSAACCAQAPERSSGTSGPGSCPSTTTFPTRSTTRRALRSRW
jgi:hypothetical protein